MSKASNAQKINQSLELLDKFADILLTTDPPYYKMEVSIQDEYDKDKIIDLSIERVLDVLFDALTKKANTDEKKALAQWSNP
mgnify:CR=1 FL=1